MRPFDQEREPFDFDFEVETMDWPWPAFDNFPTEAWRDPCPMQCTYGAAEFGEGFWFTCPVCDGSGLGGVHEC